MAFEPLNIASLPSCAPYTFWTGKPVKLLPSPWKAEPVIPNEPDTCPVTDKVVPSNVKFSSPAIVLELTDVRIRLSPTVL